MRKGARIMEHTQTERHKELMNNARELRKNMTKQERKLWYNFLRGYWIRWRRQKVIGEYIVDFYCVQLKLAIELDGSQHYEDAARVYDQKRTEFLAKMGIQVLRYTNLEVNQQFDVVCTDIDNKVKAMVEKMNRYHMKITARKKKELDE